MDIIINTNHKGDCSMKKNFLISLFVIILFTLIFSFIEVQEPNKVNEVNPIVLSINNIPNSLSKVSNLTKEEENIICATSRGLVKINEKGVIEGDLAKDVEVKSDGLEFNFILREDIYWSDGKPIDSNDVKGFFKELLQSEDESDIDALLNVYGASEFKKGKIDFDKGVAISTVNNVINIRLNQKDINFLLKLTKPQYRLRKSLALWGDLKQYYKNIVYSGDYYINDFSEDKLELVNNKKIEKNILIIKDLNTEKAMASYEVGDRDIVINPPKSTLKKLYDEELGRYYPTKKGIYLYINSIKEKMSLDVRRSLSLYIVKSIKDFEENNINAIEAAEGSYFRKDKEDLEKLQSRKVSLSKSTECTLPNKILAVVENTEDLKEYIKYLAEYFKEKDIELEYKFETKSNIENKDLRNKYDMVFIEYDADDKNREVLYDKIRKLCNESFDNLVIENNVFNLYKVVPLMFMNNNMALSEKANKVLFDSNGNLDFSRL